VRVDPDTIEDRLVAGPRQSHPRRAIAFGVIGLMLLTGLAARMVPHPVGPARTDEKYVGKAVTTARAAQSDVATVLLVSDTASRGDAFGPYTALMVSDAEEALSGVQGTFDSIQPPSTAADDTRNELDAMLSEALGHVSEVRIAARRGELTDLAQIARPLRTDARRLDAFVEQNS
jgi:hypothetical protein